jgi:hypothetical protein
VQLLFSFYDKDGNPLKGTVVESVTALEGGKVYQTKAAVPLKDGKGSDYVTNSAPSPKNQAEFNALVKQVTTPFTSKQRLTLTITVANGPIIQVTQVRTLTNQTNGVLNPFDPALGTPGYKFTMEPMKARRLKR